MYHDEISLRKMVLKEKKLKKVQSLVVIIFIFFVGSSNCIVYFIRKYVSFSFDLKEKICCQGGDVEKLSFGIFNAQFHFSLGPNS